MKRTEWNRSVLWHICAECEDTIERCSKCREKFTCTAIIWCGEGKEHCCHECMK